MFMLLVAQGYKIKENILLQDKKSTTRIENNGKDFCKVSSRHINIHYLFVKDRVDKVEKEFKYFPTHLIISDYFT